MRKQDYPWKRFWCPRDYEPSSFGSAFLPDPDEELLGPLNPEVVLFDALGSTPCLVLLGESGIGKSVGVGKEADAAALRLRASNDLALHFRLNEFTADMLSSELFGDEQVQAWRAGSGRLHLFLDSFDEEQLVVPNLADILIRKLRDWPLDRLHFRIASRGMDWPPHLEEELRGLWGSENLKAYRLAPLREADVVLAAEQNGIDPDAFLVEVREKDLSALASRPVTLEFILEYPKAGTPIPDSRQKLFAGGCERLCDEPSPLRRKVRRQGLNPAQCLMVAARIAAAMFFSGRSAVWTAPAASGSEGHDLLIQDICDDALGDTLARPRGCPPVTRVEAEQALGTGLFTSRGPNRRGWAHQSYGEFLAAWYLTRCGATVEQVMRLIRHPEGPTGKLIPQLHEIAAWLATMIPGMFDSIIATDPEVLLGADIPPGDTEKRAKLAETVLGLVGAGELNDSQWWLAAYRNMSHPGLAGQLRSRLANRTAASHLRRTAIWAATACRLQELTECLLSIALDPSEDYDLRTTAVWSLKRMGDPETRAKLCPLAFAPPSSHPDDSLRSYALEALYLNPMTTAEVLGVLDNGIPDQFGYYLADSLPVRDIPLALEWLEARERGGSTSSLDHLADRLVTRALAHVERPEVSRPLGALVTARLRKTNSLFRSYPPRGTEKLLASEPDRRRALFMAMLPRLAVDDVFHLCESHPPPITPEDVTWLVEELQRAADGAATAVIAEVIRHLAIWRADPAAFEALLAACATNGAAEQHFGHMVRPMALDDPAIRKAHYRDLRVQAGRRRWKKRHPRGPCPAEVIPGLLDRSEAGDINASYGVLVIVSQDAEGQEVADWWSPDVTKLPGWANSDGRTRRRIVAAAKAYVHGPVPCIPDWFMTRHTPFSELAGYRAMGLLLRYDGDSLRSLPTEVWRRWTPAILCCAGDLDDEGNDGGSSRSLASLAYERAPSVVVNVLRRVIRRENREDPDLTTVGRLRGCWGSRLTRAVLTELRDPDFAAGALQAFLAELLTNGARSATTFAESLLSLVSASEPPERTRAAAAAAALLQQGDSVTWAAVWPIMEGDAEFGREVIQRALPRFWDEAPPFLTRLTLRQLANLLVWLSRAFPDDGGTFGPVRAIKGWALGTLTKSGTWEACEEMRRVVGALPEAPWLKWQLQEAEENARRSRWQSPSPSAVMQLVHAADRRLVRNGRELLCLLRESLDRLQWKLQEGDRATHLWQGDPCKPKNERSFAKYVADHLEDDLRGSSDVLVDCEVEIRLGHRPDILVRALNPMSGSGRHEYAKVVIEVKGSWNRNVDEAMSDQLVESYMARTGCQHGLYLVGCFNCGRWDGSRDWRKTASRRRPIAELRQQLEQQATKLSTDGRDVRAIVLDVGWH